MPPCSVTEKTGIVLSGILWWETTSNTCFEQDSDSGLGFPHPAECPILMVIQKAGRSKHIIFWFYLCCWWYSQEEFYLFSLIFLFTSLGSLYLLKMLFWFQTSVLTIYPLLVSKKPRHHQSSFCSRTFYFKGNMACLSAKMILCFPNWGLF